MSKGFDIIINGVYRTLRLRWESAHEAAINLKIRWPSDLVQIKNTETKEVITVLPDGRTSLSRS